MSIKSSYISISYLKEQNRKLEEERTQLLLEQSKYFMEHLTALHKCRMDLLDLNIQTADSLLETFSFKKILKDLSNGLNNFFSNIFS